MNDIRPPKPETLKKYGLTEEDWRAILERQGGVCAVCEKEPKSGRLNIDHDHVPRFKKLPPEKRKLHVRGLLCYWCNLSYVGRAITIPKARNVVAYLEEYANRRAA